MLQNFFKNKNISKKLRLILKNTIIDKTLTYALETSTLTKRGRKQLNIFERKVCRRILGPVYDNEKENWRILTNEEIYANINPLPVQFKAVLRGQKGCVFFSGHLNLPTTPEIGLPSRKKNHNN